MARRPENVHVYLFRKSPEGEYEFAVFQRADDPKCWQGVSGGVEDGEIPVQAALRESFEEAGAPADSPIYRLDTMSYLPSHIFADCSLWGGDVIVCPMYFFAIPFGGDIALSEEHIQARWLTYEKAEALTYWHDQKVALWELKERLAKDKMIRIK